MYLTLGQVKAMTLTELKKELKNRLDDLKCLGDSMSNYQLVYLNKLIPTLKILIKRKGKK